MIQAFGQKSGAQQERPFWEMAIGISPQKFSHSFTTSTFEIVSPSVRRHGQGCSLTQVFGAFSSGARSLRHLSTTQIRILDCVLVLALALVVRVYFSQGRLLGMDPINQSEFVNNLVHFSGFPQWRLYMAPGSSFSYPPLALLLEALFASMFNVKVVYVAVWAAIVASACLAPVTYLLGIEVLNSRVGALLGSLFIGFSYLDLEFLGWSAFPSILGVLLSSVVIYLVFKYLKSLNLRDLLGFKIGRASCREI